jgi:hypothetical protein
MKVRKYMLPNFLVIGAEKSATTWLYNRLKEHPDIFMPETKEIHFFNKYDSNFNEKDIFNENNLGYYKKFFKRFNGEKAIGEVTPMYLCDPYAPKRIKQILPKVKLIAILRNPIDRAYSHYWMAKSKGHTDLNFKKIVENKEDKFIKRGLYFNQLKKYYDLFDQCQIKIIIFSEIKKNEELVLKDIYNFLDVNSDFITENLNNRENSSSKYRSKFLVNFISRTSDLFRLKLKMGFIINFLKKIGVADFIKNINKESYNYPKMKDEYREKLIDYYKKENYRLSKLINKNLDYWSE